VSETTEIFVAGDTHEAFFPPYGPLEGFLYIPWPKDIPRFVMVGNEIMELLSGETLDDGQVKLTVRRGTVGWTPKAEMELVK
jgi:hypothetical protein